MVVVEVERFVLACTRCGRVEPFALKGRCACGGTLVVDYDITLLRQKWSRDTLQSRPFTMWRYRELLPLREESQPVSLGEGGTPLLRMAAAEARLGLGALYSKREELNPTGSFKARGFSSAVSLQAERGIRRTAVNSNGNAASALAAYAARAGMEAFVFVPKDCPGAIVEECVLYGAHTYLVDGLIQDAGKLVEEGEPEMGWFHTGTLREPGRAEGKKTMGLEISEQLGWKLPDVILYPTGGGSGIVGMWRAFTQLKELGWVQGELPRLFAVQEAGCDPIVRLLAGATESELQQLAAETSASPTGLRVPCPPDGALVAGILRLTGGGGVAVSREEIAESGRELARMGLSASPEGASTWAGLLRLHAAGQVGPRDRIVLFNTSHAAKYWPYRLPSPPPVVRTYADFRRVRQAGPPAAGN